MTYFVYVVKSQTTGRHYIGHTADVERRLQDHNRGKDRSVRGRGPFNVVLTEPYGSRAEAMARERQIKSYKGGEAFRRLIASAGAIMSPSSSGRTTAFRADNAGSIPAGDTTI